MAKLHFYYAAMNAGKSTVLIQSSHNYHERGMDTLIYTPCIDTRDGSSHVASRIGMKMEASPFQQHTDLYQSTILHQKKIKNLRCVLVDEAQFLTKNQVFQLCHITDRLNLPVLTYGLRTDFLGNTFEGSQYLLAWADILIELKTICFCGAKATMNLRVNEHGEVVREGEQIEIGGNDRYLSVCRAHFFTLERIDQEHWQNHRFTHSA